jgi:ketosteroid isomerase-like protein
MLTRLSFAFGALLLIISGALASVGPALQAQAQAHAGDPASVITGYEMARNRRDVDGALAYFADDATIVQRNTTFSGRDEIRRFLENATARSRFIVVTDRQVMGDQVTWTERNGGGQGTQGQLANLGSFTLTVEATIQDGKIKSLAYTGFGQAQTSQFYADGRAQVPAPLGLGAVVVLLAGVVLVASTGVGRPGGTRSRLHGRLMQDLQGWAAARQ